MATPYSDPNLYFKIAPVESTNWDLAFKALQYKQGQYDANKMRIDSVVQQYLSTDIIKPEVKEKFVQNINKLVAEVNEMGNTDLSDRSITSRIISHIGKALDAPTVQAINVSKQVRNEELLIDEIKKKKPALYSDINRQDMYNRRSVGGQSLNEWLSDGDANSVFRGSVSYTPYTNIHEKYDKLINNLLAKRGDEEITIPTNDPEGIQVQKVKISGLSRQQLMQLVSFGMSEEDKNQMRINASAKYGWYQTPESVDLLKRDVNELISTNLTAIESDLLTTELQLTHTTEGSESHKRLQGEVNQLNKNKEYFQNRLLELDSKIENGEFESLGAEIYSTEFTQQMVSKYSSLYKETFLGFGVDEYGKYIKDHNFKVQQELDKERRHQETTAAKKAGEEGTPTVMQTSLPLEDPDDIRSIEGNIIKEMDGLRTQVVENGIRYLSHLSSPDIVNDSNRNWEALTVKKAYNLAVIEELTKTAGKNEAYSMVKGKTPIQVLQEFDPSGVILSNTLKKIGAHKFSTSINEDNINFVTNILDSADHYGQIAESMDKLKNEEMSKLQTVDSGESLEKLVSSEYKVVTMDADGTPRTVDAKTVVQDVLVNGKPVKGKTISDSSGASAVDNTYQALKIMNTTNKDTHILGVLTTLGGGIGVLAGDLALRVIGKDKIIISSKEEVALKNLTKSLGEDPSIVKQDSTLGIKYLTVDKNSNTGKYLEAVSKIPNKIFGSNENLTKDGKFKRQYDDSHDYKQSVGYKEGIKKIHGNLASNQTISINSDSGIGVQLVNLANMNPANSMYSAKKDVDNPIMLRETAPNTYEILQRAEVGSGDKKQATTQVIATVSRDELIANIPGITNHINFDKTKQIYTYDKIKGKSFSSPGVTFFTDNTPASNDNSLVGNDPVEKMKLRPDTAYQYFMSSSQAAMNMAMSYDPQIPTKLKRAIQKSENYSVQARMVNSGVGVDVVVEMFNIENPSSPRLVHTVTVPGQDNLDGLVKQIKYTPQIIYINMVERIISENFNKNSVKLPTAQPEFTTIYNELFNK